MIKKFYEETGMYIDWKQLSKLPDIDTLIDIGVSINGTPKLYERFEGKKLILVDPLDEAKEYAKNKLKHRNVTFYQTALGKVDDQNFEIKVQKKEGFTSLLEISDFNMEDNYSEKRKIKINRLDTILNNKKDLGKIGIKIDVEGYELDVLKGSLETLKYTKFVIAEVRHNHESLKEVYKLHEFMNLMNKNNFVLTMILTAKPFIADLCFQPNNELSFEN